MDFQKPNAQRMMPHEHRRATLGPMTFGRRLQTEPTYFRTLLAVGLIGPKTSIPSAFKVWAKVCVDPIVLVHEKKIREKQTHSFNIGKNQLTHKAILELAESTAELTNLRLRIEGRSEGSQK